MKNDDKFFGDDEEDDNTRASAIIDQGENFFSNLDEAAADGGNEGFADFDNFDSKLKASNSEGSVGNVSEDDETLEDLPPFNPSWDYSQGWNFLLRQPLKKKFTQNRSFGFINENILNKLNIITS